MNLARNAIRFCRPGGRVEVAWVPSRDGVEIVVADEGSGISAKDLPRIFDLFWQGESGCVRRHGGIGLGLTLTRRLVAALGGSIDVESEVGVGTRFSIRLPGARLAA